MGFRSLKEREIKMIIEFKLPIRSYYGDEVIFTNIYYDCESMPLKEDVIESQKKIHEKNINFYDYNELEGEDLEGEDIIHALETMNEYKNIEENGLVKYSFLSEVIGIGEVSGWVSLLNVCKI